MESARILLEVVAGVLPGTPIPEFTKQFAVTNTQWEDETGESIMKVYGFAQEYMRTLWNPKIVNWVRMDWIYV